MARHRKYEVQEEANPELDISSLIDVCFLLLIYFIVTSTISPRETDLGMALPSNPNATPSEQPKIDPLYIRIDARGAIFTGIGGDQIPMDSDLSVRQVPLLLAQLDLYAGVARAANATPLVQIDVDEECTQQRVIDVLNALAAVKISTVTFTDSVQN